MTNKTPRPPVQGAAVVGGVLNKRCSSSPTTGPDIAQPPKRKAGGPHRHAGKSDGPSPRDAARQYSSAQLHDMDRRFRLAMARVGKAPL